MDLEELMMALGHCCANEGQYCVVYTENSSLYTATRLDNPVDCSVAVLDDRALGLPLGKAGTSRKALVHWLITIHS